MPVLIAACCVMALGLFLNVRGIIRLIKSGEKKLSYWAIGFFLVMPVVIVLLYQLLIHGRVEEAIWVYFPLMISFVVWACEGFFVEAYLKKEMQRKMDGIKKVIPTAPKNHVTKNVILLVVSIAIWIFGVVVGFPNPTLSTCALCICIYLFVRAIAAFWRYRGF